MVVYDITDGNSFEIVQGWLKEIHENCYSVALILVGNKCDNEKQRIVEKKDASSFASQMGIEFIETSAKENVNVTQLFEMLTNSMMELRQAKIEENFGVRTRVHLEHSSSKPRSCLC